jgi:hypothetical protein
MKTRKNIVKYCIFILQRNLHEIFDTILLKKHIEYPMPMPKH